MEGRLARERVWNGQVPILITLHPSLTAATKVPPFATMAWRCSYLPLLLPQIKRHFGRQINLPHGRLYLLQQGKPVASHLPLGLLYDLQANTLVWNLELGLAAMGEHSEAVIMDEVEMSIRFFATLKQADALRSATGGQARRVMALSKADQTQLWEALQAHRADLYWSINEQLVAPLARERAAIRLYENGQVRQPSLPLEPGMTLAVLGEGRYRLHGVEISPSTPLAWLNEHLAYPDNLLHLIKTPL